MYDRASMGEMISILLTNPLGRLQFLSSTGLHASNKTASVDTSAIGLALLIRNSIWKELSWLNAIQKFAIL